MKECFDSKKYLKLQSERIKERIKMFDKLYIEFGGKLVDDYHASRVLPGFEPDIKIKLLQEFKGDVEVILCINANDIAKNKIRSDRVISYDVEVFRLIEFLRSKNITIDNVVITLFNNQDGITKFKNKLKDYNIKTYIHTFTKGYPTDVDTIVSEEGYGANPYIETTKKLILVNAPGPGSGKLATCLSQIYHENKRGVNAGYAKFETFPVWNLPLKHPVNLAYEAATADLKDVNMIDPFHLEKYKKTAVNYNRDVEVFPVLKAILKKVVGKDIYYSPTDMGVNVIASCIIDDEVVCEAAKKEIVRRYYQATNDYKLGTGDEDAFKRIKLLMNELNIDEKYLDVIEPALEKSEKEGVPVISMKVGKKILTGKQTDLLTPAGSLILNAIKELTKIPDDVDLLSPSVLEPITKYKNKISDNVLNLQELVIALSICSVTNPIVNKALNNLSKLENCDAHSSYILEDTDYYALKNLKINITCEPIFKD